MQLIDTDIQPVEPKTIPEWWNDDIEDIEEID